MAIQVFIFSEFDAQFEFEIRIIQKNIKTKRLKTKIGQAEFDRVPILFKS
jgi:hypothetical protein